MTTSSPNFQTNLAAVCHVSALHYPFYDCASCNTIMTGVEDTPACNKVASCYIVACYKVARWCGRLCNTLRLCSTPLCTKRWCERALTRQYFDGLELFVVNVLVVNSHFSNFRLLAYMPFCLYFYALSQSCAAHLRVLNKFIGLLSEGRNLRWSRCRHASLLPL